MAPARTLRTIVVAAVAAVLAAGALAGLPAADAARPGTLTGVGCLGDQIGGVLSGANACGSGYEHIGGTGVPVVNAAGTMVYVSNYSDDTVVWLSRAADGTLTPQGCIADAPAPDGCAEAQGLDAVWGISLSPDGQQLYAAGYNDQAVVRLDVGGTGALTDGGCISAPGGPCATTTTGLEHAYAVVVPRDGKDVYVSSWDNDGSIVQLRRATSGALSATSCVRALADEDCAGAPGVRAVSWLAASPDGTSLYATSYTGAVAMLGRNPSTGSLSSLGCVSDADVTAVPPLGCAGTATALTGAQGIVVSHDGSSVYVVATGDNAVTHLHRSADGTLTDGGCVQDVNAAAEVVPVCAGSAEGLDQVAAVVMAPDDDQVLTGSIGDNAIATFNRSADGTLAAGSCITDAADESSGAVCASSTEGLNGSYALGLSPNGRSVYVGGYSDDALVTLARQLAAPAASLSAAKRQRMSKLLATVRADARATTRLTGTAVATYRVKGHTRHHRFPVRATTVTLLPDTSVTKRLGFEKPAALRKLLARGAKVTVKLTATTVNDGGRTVRSTTVRVRG